MPFGTDERGKMNNIQGIAFDAFMAGICFALVIYCVIWAGKKQTRQMDKLDAGKDWR